MVNCQMKRIDSTDENVSKYVFDFGNAVAESVLYKYPTYEERTVICCSTMSGCPVGCRFCFDVSTLVNVAENGQWIEKPISEIRVGDMLMGINTDNKVNEVMERDYSGLMIEVELENGESFRVTEDHEMLNSFGGVVLAKDLCVGYELL